MFGDGFIPAHAGKTVGHRLQHQDRRAHPRSRGENGANVNGTSLPTGSSPLTRGKHLCADAVTWDQGLIPTHAGKTCLAGLVGAHSEAHPRSRGENVGALSGGGCVQGSSPLTRGKRGHGSDRVGTGGLIPTHAGKTRPRSSGARTRWAHPHSRGENPTLSWASGEVTGSSPLTRGKRFDPVGAHDLRGLIPTHAGKTRRALAVQRGSRGSSPLTRGKLPLRVHARSRRRLIPTHAGKTLCSWRFRARARAHPHSRGENE